MNSKLHLKKLDSIRGFAAFYVIIYHLTPNLEIIPDFIKITFLSFGQEAVMLFFLLSGFVIYLSVHNKPDLTFKDYFIRRFRRIYFPFLIALLLSIVILYLNSSGTKRFSWGDLLGNIFMLQDLSNVKPGTWFRPFLGNFPLWSLSYEWWFYMMFYPIYKNFFKNEFRIYFILAVSFLAYIFYMIYPNQPMLFISYFIVWWCGVEASDIFLRTRRFTWRQLKPIFISLLSMSILALIPVVLQRKIEFGYYPFLIFRHFFFVFIIVVIAWLWYQRKLIIFDKIFGVFTVLAPISYGLYIFHYPILARWNLSHYFSNVWLDYTIKIILIFALSYVVEIKLQPIVNRWLK